ncbi:hypothetical protein I4U23_031019 [Adineta vaga]|nr:hypothetical protein I4U23_031019 [Adineta vaga]
MVNIKELQQYAVHLLAECFATCILILIALMLVGSITGAHLNPALSISLMTIRKVKPLQCIFYIIGQILGAFLGAALVYLVYLKQFDAYDGGVRQMTGDSGTADIFFTMPSVEFNHMMSNAMKPFAFALIVIGIICGFSINAGAAINPARDLGPRLFGAFIYGWNEVFSVHNYFFWVPIIGPIIGAIVGVWLYQGFMWIVKQYGHLSISDNSDTNKTIDSKITPMQQNESFEF